MNTSVKCVYCYVRNIIPRGLCRLRHQACGLALEVHIVGEHGVQGQQRILVNNGSRRVGNIRNDFCVLGKRELAIYGDTMYYYKIM
jgi:hypothetical protein